MARQLKPCGTYAAYARHLRNGEKPCEPCAEANRERSYAAPSGFNNYEREMARALDAKPPQITWRKDARGVMRAVSVYDPHRDRHNEISRGEALARFYEMERATAVIANRTRPERRVVQPLTCESGHEFSSWNTILNPDGSFDCRDCNAPQDTELQAAARKSI